MNLRALCTLPLLLPLLTVAPPVAADTAELIAQGEAQIQAQDLDGAVATFTKAVEEDPSSSVAHTRLGGALLLNQDYEGAIPQFQDAISADANNTEAFVGMAMAYLHTSRYQLAKAALAETKRIDPSKAQQVDEIAAWIDERTLQAPSAH